MSTQSMKGAVDPSPTSRTVSGAQPSERCDPGRSRRLRSPVPQELGGPPDQVAQKNSRAHSQLRPHGADAQQIRHAELGNGRHASTALPLGDSSSRRRALARVCNAVSPCEGPRPEPMAIVDGVDTRGELPTRPRSPTCAPTTSRTAPPSTASPPITAPTTVALSAPRRRLSDRLRLPLASLSLSERSCRRLLPLLSRCAVVVFLLLLFLVGLFHQLPSPRCARLAGFNLKCCRPPAHPWSALSSCVRVVGSAEETKPLQGGRSGGERAIHTLVRPGIRHRGGRAVRAVRMSRLDHGVVPDRRSARAGLVVAPDEFAEALRGEATAADLGVDLREVAIRGQLIAHIEAVEDRHCLIKA
ncbi:MAG: hypothetical protein JWR63_1674 [Conexibacter sp.]|nr:hypothetical protein [Conexibacter sp.]